MKYCRWVLIFFSSMGLLSCGGQSSSNNSGATACSMAALESEMTSLLQSISDTDPEMSVDPDYTLYIEKASGENYTYNKGSSTLDTAYQSASTSKWVTAVAVLRVVDDEAGFNLSDQVSTHYAWSMDSGDPLYGATLSQLLSFTSGLESDPVCISLGIGSKTFDECINDATASVVAVNEGSGESPGASFYYSGSHMHVAGAMAIAAGSYTDW